MSVVLIIASMVSVTEAAVYVRGHFRSNGTCVRSHFRSNPDGNFSNNWSTYGNVNPYTGAIGTRRMPSYSGGHSLGGSNYSFSSPSYTSPGSGLGASGSIYGGSLGSSPSTGGRSYGGFGGSSRRSGNWVLGSGW